MLCADGGIELEIFERAPKLREIGAGLMIWPNGTRSLHALGVEADALPLVTLSICSRRGRPLSQYPLSFLSTLDSILTREIQARAR